MPKFRYVLAQLVRPGQEKTLVGLLGDMATLPAGPDVEVRKKQVAQGGMRFELDGGDDGLENPAAIKTTHLEFLSRPVT